MQPRKPLKLRARDNKVSRRGCSVLATWKKQFRRAYRGFSTVVFLLPSSPSQYHAPSLLLRVARLHRIGYRVRVMLMPSQCSNAEIQPCELLSAVTQEHSGCPMPEATSVEAKYIASLLVAARALLFLANNHLGSYALTPNACMSDGGHKTHDLK